jgi:hypothetical protein
VSDLFRFPNPVDEHAARSVAAGVVGLTALILVLSGWAGTGWLDFTVVLAYGFLARLASGPRFSPLGQLATRVVAPRLAPAKPVPGPPKRFAQGIGAVLSVAAVIAHLGFGADGLAQLFLAAILVAASLESALGYCLGCRMFSLLMRAGLIPADTCEACNDVSRRLAIAAADSGAR